MAVVNHEDHVEESRDIPCVDIESTEKIDTGTVLVPPPTQDPNDPLVNRTNPSSQRSFRTEAAPDIAELDNA